MKGGDAHKKPFQAESRGGSPLPGSKLKTLEDLANKIDELKESDELNAEEAIFWKLFIPVLADVYKSEGIIK